jgi:hypothetical protein
MSLLGSSSDYIGRRFRAEEANVRDLTKFCLLLSSPRAQLVP